MVCPHEYEGFSLGLSSGAAPDVRPVSPDQHLDVCRDAARQRAHDVTAFQARHHAAFAVRLGHGHELLSDPGIVGFNEAEVAIINDLEEISVAPYTEQEASVFIQRLVLGYQIHYSSDFQINDNLPTGLYFRKNKLALALLFANHD